MNGFPKGLAGYAPVELIGRGAAALAFKAWQQSTGQFVTIKTPHDSSNPRMAEHFAQETRACARLAHPHIVRLIDAGQAAQARPYCVFEYIPGETLRDHLLRHGPLERAAAVALMAQLLDALACVHARGLAHRDLKPQNILVTATGARPHLKLIDFGIAAGLGTTAPAEGTPAYCAPEQLRGEPVAATADLYAWGLLFVECLTGKPAASGTDAAGTALGTLLRKVLHEDAAPRCGDARALHGELLALDGTVPAAPPPAAPAPAPLAAGPAAVLCLNLMLTPLPDAQVPLDALGDLQADHLEWCAEVLAQEDGQAAGALGDRLLFHFGEATQQGSVRRAAWAALQLRDQAMRRGRVLEIQHGVRMEWRASLHAAQLSPAAPAAFGRAANLALHLNRMAQPGSILASAQVRDELQAVMRFEPPPQPGATGFTLLSGF